MEKILTKPEEQKNKEQESKEKTLPKKDAYWRAKVIASVYLDDKKAVQQTKEACEPFRIKLLDSIIIGKNKYYSAAEKEERDGKTNNTYLCPFAKLVV